MIDRYRHPKISSLFSEERRVEIFALIELTIVRRTDLLHKLDFQALLEDMRHFEKHTRHETVAFIEALLKQLPEDTPPIHLGITSSDILDTCLAIQMREACDVVLAEIDSLLSSLSHLCHKYKKTMILGRSHGKGGELTSLGLSFLSYYEEWCRNRERLKIAREEISYGMISGPMGNYTNTSPLLEEETCVSLGLSAERVSTQVIPRDRHAFLMSVLGIIGSSLERLSVHVRNLSQSGIEEVSESFGVGQKGSSAMPHKKNPILSENVTGLARLLKGYAGVSLDNVALWFERDMSHSSVERVIIEDAFHLSAFAIKRMSGVFSRLEVDEVSLAENIKREGDKIYSHSVLCHLIENGIPRNEAYSFIQSLTHKYSDLFTELKEAYPNLDLSPSEIDFSLNIDYIYLKVFGAENGEC